MNRPARHRVVVTGCGIVTPHGIGWRENSIGFRTGAKRFGEVSLFDVSRQRCRRAAEVDTERLNSCIVELCGKRTPRLDRSAKLWLAAATEAWRQSAYPLAKEVPSFVGTTSGGMALGEGLLREARTTPCILPGQSHKVVHYMGHHAAVEAARFHGWTSPPRVVACACASGASAIAHAWRHVAAGRSSIAVAGGYDALSHLVFAGFDSLQALSLTSCRPFAESRDGLMLGEGAAALVLETLDAAQSRGAHILGEIAGCATAIDCHHLTQPEPSGSAAVSCLNEVCSLAGWHPSDVDYLNAHGTGTLLNDASETAAIHAWAGTEANRLAVSSTKSSVGHLLGAAGAVEAAVCLMALDGQWLPPQTETGLKDPACGFDLVDAPREQAVQRILSNSFGFGGANACLALWRRP